MSFASEKGKLLERAVDAIERAILHTSPSLKPTRFKIENNKIAVINGVRHEIDLYVTVDCAHGYPLLYIFECKNWETKVSKVEVNDFSEKIRACAAARGLFIAKSFSSSALAQAKLDGRIELVVAHEHTPQPSPFLRMRFCVPEGPKIKLFFLGEASGTDGGNLEPVVLESTHGMYDGKSYDLAEMATAWAAELLEQEKGRRDAAEPNAGELMLIVEAERHFVDGLQVGDTRFAACRLVAEQTLRYIHPPIVADFQVGTRGRTLSFEDVPVGKGHVGVSFVQLPPEQTKL